MARHRWCSVAPVALLAAAIVGGDAFEVWCVAHPFSPMETSMRLAMELQGRGHKVRIGSTDKATKRVTQKGIPFMELGPHPLKPHEEFELLAKISNSTGMRTIMTQGKVIFDGTDTVMWNGLRKLADAGQRLPDIMVCSLPSASCARFAEAHGIPFVYTLPMFSLMSPLVTQVPYVPLSFPHFPYGEMAVWQRLANILGIFAMVYIAPLAGWPNEVFGHIMATVPKHLLLVPGVPGLDYPQHTPPLVQYTGPYLSARDVDPALLSEEVRAWLDRPGAAPVVYISMGTVVQLTSHLCQVFLEAVRGAAAAGEFRALWALPANQQSCLGPDGAQDLRGPAGPLLISPWVPTPAALAHPAVRVFLSHCGANGAMESIWNRVPIVGLPFFGDHHLVSRHLRGLGLSIELDRYTVTAAELRDAVRRLTTEPGFAAGLARIGHVLRTYRGVQKAADLVEMVHALGGDLRFLETASTRQGVLKAYCLDLLLAAVGLLSLACFLCGRASGRGQRAPVSEERAQASEGQGHSAKAGRGKARRANKAE